MTEITQREKWVVESAARERFGRPVEIQEADVELRLDPAIPVLTTCPALVWMEEGTTFLIAKVGEGRYRSQFFYSVREQYGTGQSEYDDLALCVSTLLKYHEDFAKNREQRA